MTTPSLITTRRFSPSLRLKLQVLFARAWEALAETYYIQAATFVRRVTPSLPVDEALDRYFRDVGVPAAMAATVRARALIALAPLFGLAANGRLPEARTASEPETEESGMPWRVLRFDQLVGTLRQRAHYVEETNLQCRLAACVADEAVVATHVRMALETVDALAGELPPDEAIMHYVRTFDLPALEGQIIFQRAMAQWAEQAAPHPSVAVSRPEADSVCASAPKLELVAVHSLGLRIGATV